jgi:hypothetical protein
MAIGKTIAIQAIVPMVGSSDYNTPPPAGRGPGKEWVFQGNVFGPEGSWKPGQGGPIMGIEMKARFLLLFVGILTGTGISMPVQAGDCENNPTCYTDPRLLLEKLRRLPDAKHMTQKDLEMLSAEIHNVSVLKAPINRADLIPANTRPTGKLKLKTIIPVDIKN